MLIHGPTGNLIGDVPVMDRTLKEGLSLLPVLSFSALQEDDKRLPLEAVAETKFGRFVLKEKKKSGDRYDYVAKPDIDDLLSDLVTKAYVTMTVAQMGGDLLAGTGWTILSSSTEKRTVTLNEETRYDGILAIVDRFKYEIHWDIKQKIITIEPKIGRENAGLYIHDQVNLRDVSPAADSYDLITRIVPRGAGGMGIESINGGVPYLENFSYTNKVKTARWTDERYFVIENLMADAQKILDERCRVRQAFQADVSDLAKADPDTWGFLDYQIGDTVDLISVREGIDQKQRIIERVRYLDELDADTVTIANTLRDYTVDSDSDLDEVRTSTSVARASLELLEESVESRVTKETYSQDQETLEGQLSNLSSEIIQQADSIRTEVSETYVTGTGLDTYKATVASQFKQLSESFNFDFTALIEELENIDGNVTTKFIELAKHIIFEDGEIILNATSSDPTADVRSALRITREKISFLYDNTEVAYLSKNKLHVTDGRFLNSLQIGNFAFRPRPNGSLSFGRVV